MSSSRSASSKRLKKAAEPFDPSETPKPKTPKGIPSAYQIFMQLATEKNEIKKQLLETENTIHDLELKYLEIGPAHPYGNALTGYSANPASSAAPASSPVLRFTSPSTATKMPAK